MFCCRSTDRKLDDSVSDRELIAMAQEGLDNAHCPYSKFPVSAILVTQDGTVFRGVNVENASSGGTICAERSALVAAVSLGHREFRSVTVVSKLNSPISPCGMCRQVLIEFGDFKVIMGGANGSIEVSTISDLMPMPFTTAAIKELKAQAN